MPTPVLPAIVPLGLASDVCVCSSHLSDSPPQGSCGYERVFYRCRQWRFGDSGLIRSKFSLTNENRLFVSLPCGILVFLHLVQSWFHGAGPEGSSGSHGSTWGSGGGHTGESTILKVRCGSFGIIIYFIFFHKCWWSYGVASIEPNGIKTVWNQEWSDVKKFCPHRYATFGSLLWLFEICRFLCRLI